MKLFEIERDDEFDIEDTTVKVLGYTVVGIARSDIPDTSVDVNLGPLTLSAYICAKYPSLAAAVDVRLGVRLAKIWKLPVLVPTVYVGLELPCATLDVRLF